MSFQEFIERLVRESRNNKIPLPILMNIIEEEWEHQEEVAMLP